MRYVLVALLGDAKPARGEMLDVFLPVGAVVHIDRPVEDHKHLAAVVDVPAVRPVGPVQPHCPRLAAALAATAQRPQPASQKEERQTSWHSWLAADDKQIGIVFFDDVEELDAVGPWEALGHWTSLLSEDGYAVSCESASGGLVRCAKGLVVQADHSYARGAAFEVFVYPGGRGTRSAKSATSDRERTSRRELRAAYVALVEAVGEARHDSLPPRRSWASSGVASQHVSGAAEGLGRPRPDTLIVGI